MARYKYKVDIRWSDEDEAYIARAPELDGVVTHGDDLLEAARNMDVAIRLYLKSLAKHNEPAPKPVSLESLSGQYPLRMGKERHQDLVVLAQSEGISINELLNRLIDAGTLEPDSHIIRQPTKSYKAGSDSRRPRKKSAAKVSVVVKKSPAPSRSTAKRV
jgi:predicted RNase H-like HicB family nuclease